ncbi:MAG: extracellular solute-binding protein [Cytophagales bacterium]|nr:extracellular solute-binding protein [Cytophagales bacterium]
MFLKVSRRLVMSLAAVLMLAAQAQTQVQQPSIVMASTTSTEQSGLFSYLLPEFTRTTGIVIKVVALGTGQALDMARRGDADVVFVHDLAAEEKFLAEGFGVRRYDVMYNDFVLIGPQSDPSKVAGKDVMNSFKKIAATSAAFVSRGDKSGTHAAELRYWGMAGLMARESFGAAYKECGCAMGQALNMAAAADMYVLADRGTWLNFKNRRNLKILVEGDTKLFNQYGVMTVNPAKHPHVKVREAQAFVDWVISPAGQAVIAAYKINGEQLFFPNAK